MILSWTPTEQMRQRGFTERTLSDGRACRLWARGYFFDSSGRLWLDGEIGEWLAEQLNTTTFAEIAPGMNGCFAVVVVWPGANVAEVGIDRFGTIPLFCHCSNRSLIVSDDFWEVAGRLATVAYDAEAAMSMVLLGYVTGYGTLLKGITELPPAATHRFSLGENTPQPVSHPYWKLSYRAGPRRKRGAWRDALAQTFHSVFQRYAQAALGRGWNLHVPLSGGKDSRLLAGMFNRNRAPVRAFSYGPSGNAEEECASRVASALSIPLRFVSVDDPSGLSSSLIQMITRRVGMRARFTAGLGGQLSLVSFSEQDAYVPGHTGDFVTGGHLRRGALVVRSEAQAVRHLADIHSLPVLDEIATALFPMTWSADSRIKIISSDWQFDADDATGSIDRWDCENRQRRLILSELRTYEQFGRWMLPFYDYDLFDFFAEVPLRLRYQQHLYIDTLIHNLFVDDLAVLMRIPIAYQGILHLPALSWRDWVLMRKLAAPFGDWVLRRATNSKRREHLRSVGVRSPEATGPDPLDHWWHDYPWFHDSVIETFRGWDGMHGIIDVAALVSILRKPLPRLFIQFGVPALLTLRHFQQIVEADDRGVPS